MPRREHPTDLTVGESHRIFGEVIRSLGMDFANEPADLALQRLVFEGTPFGGRPALLRRPGSKFYDKTYTEARAVASAIVALNLHASVVDVRRAAPPAPDITIVYPDRNLYVEHAMVLDERAMTVDVAIEDANFAVHEIAAGDSELQALFECGVLCVRLERVDVATGVDVQALPQETAALVKTVTTEDEVLRPDPAAYPELARSGAFGKYKRCAARTVMPLEAHDLDRPSQFEPTMKRILTQKHEAVRQYDPSCRPAWLVLSVSHGYELLPMLRARAQQIVESHGLGGFDRIIIQIPRQSPLEFTRNK